MTHEEKIATGKNPLTRDELLTLLADAVRLTASRVNAVKFRTKAGDKDRLAYARALAQLAGVAATILKDTQIDELNTRLTALEQQREHEKSQRY